MPGALTDVLPWIVVAGFGLATLLEHVSRRTGRAFAAATWVLFGGFWLPLGPEGLIEAAFSTLAASVCILTGYLTWSRRPSLLVLSRAIAITGAIYLPFYAVPALSETTIELTADLAASLAAAAGYDPVIRVDPMGYESQLTLVGADGHTRWITVIVACSGVGSIAVVSGLVMAVRAPLARRFEILAACVPVIYVLNVLRVAFIALAYGHQWFHVYPDAVLGLFGATAPRRVSYFVADRIIAQVFATAVLTGVVLWLLRALPALADVFDEAGYVLTGRDPGLRHQLRSQSEP